MKLGAVKNISTRNLTSSNLITISGYWPCEEDQLTIKNLDYTPKVGDRVVFNNLGAYVNEWRYQFEYNNGLVDFCMLRRDIVDFHFLSGQNNEYTLTT